ncbi:MAG: hypothetical protein HQ518_11470 [Rhodopirellula sp.]|nr:hypothetical protein [Rhodopirellula sp.]
MPQFVLLEHDHPELHWDFMLEHGDVLLTWRLDRIPSLACEIAAMHLPDHRKAYLDYEGPVSGNRGSVTRIDRGNFELLASSAGDLTARLQGTTLQGSVRLSKISPHSSRDESHWRMIWQPD